MEEITKQIETAHLLVNRIRSEVGKTLVGQEKLVDGLLTGLLTGGHVLIEGVPGLAKTSAVKSAGVRRSRQILKRIQFTPDLLPADLTGTRNLPAQNHGFCHPQGARCSTILFWPTKSTGPRPKCSPHCWRPWKKSR